MAGDDHPDKKMVAAGDNINGKGKAIVKEDDKENTTDDEESSEDISSGAETGSSSEVPPVKKSKTDLTDQPAPPAPATSSPPPAPVAAHLQVPCPLCHRVFDSYPAMFGHQRVHKERTYRGAYPPPTFQREGSLHPPRQVEETEEAMRHAAQLLIDMSNGRFEKPAISTSIKEAEEASSSNMARGVSIDLNIPLEVEEEEEQVTEEKDDVGPDLNKSPPGSD